MAVNQDDLIENLDKDQQVTLDLDTGQDDKEVKEPDQKDEEKKQDDAQEKEEKGEIPYAALKKEREKWQRRMEGMEQKLSKYDQLEQKLNQFYEAQAAKDTEARAPDYEENPAEHLRYRQEQLEQTQEKISKDLTEQEKYREQMKKDQQLIQAIHADETRFVKEKPDYYKALNLVMDKEREKALLAGYDDVEAQSVLTDFVLRTATQKIGQHESPAEFVYELAKFYGYKNEEVSKAEEKLDQLEEGMKASKTLGSGAKPKLDDLEKLPLTEFDQAMKEMFG